MSPTILVVDDHLLYRTTFCALLQLCWPAAQIVEAADASQALALFPQRTWDLIVLDYQLPTLTGGDLARHLRARAHAHGQVLPPLVLMSTQPDAATFARALGAVTFLPKPVDVDMLRTALTPLLAVRATDHMVQPAPPPTQMTTTALPRPIVPVSTRINQLHERMLSLVQQTINRFPPPHAPVITLPPRMPTGRVGDYLVQLGYLTRWELMRALQTSRSPTQRARVPLGFTVVAQHLVPSAVVSAILLQQFRDRLAAGPTTAPRFIGEHLLLHAELEPAQLALALQEQLDGYRQGCWARLGDILARDGWRDPTAIRAVAPDRLRRD
jgi:CheY-like chemotaxis protein